MPVGSGVMPVQDVRVDREVAEPDLLERPPDLRVAEDIANLDVAGVEVPLAGRFSE